MPEWVKGLLTGIIFTVQGALTTLLFPLVILPAITHHPWDPTWWAIIGGGLSLLYGVEAGVLVIYDLETVMGWVQFIADVTWSLPNTLFGLIFGNLIYVFRGTLSSALSRHSGWVVYSGGSGYNQTLGTVNLGGAGEHERMHLLQARILGPLYLPFFAANYVVNFILQGLWTITLGAILYKAGVRETPYFRPPERSVVKGFWGWIYYANVMELMAYAWNNP